MGLTLRHTLSYNLEHTLRHTLEHAIGNSFGHTLSYNLESIGYTLEHFLGYTQGILIRQMALIHAAFQRHIERITTRRNSIGQQVKIDTKVLKEKENY